MSESGRESLPKRDLIALVAQLLPAATAQVRAALQDDGAAPGDRSRRRQAEALLLDAGGQTTGMQAALLSAMTEMQRALPLDAAQTWSTELLAAELIRLAYNRWQRRRRRDERLRHEAERGQALLAQAVAKKSEIHAQIGDLIDELVAGLSERGRTIVRLRLDGKTQDEIAKHLGCHRTTVSRLETQIADRWRDLVHG